MPSSPLNNGIRIVPVARAHRRAAAAVLASAFRNDPHVTGLLPARDRDRRLRGLFSVMISESWAAGGHAWMAVDAASGDPLGAALWEAPGSAVPRSHRALHLLPYMRIFGARTLYALDSDTAANAYRPKVAHWYLKDLGTAPHAQGRGVASALVRHRMAEADAAGVGAYLESSRRENVPFYERLGFVDRGQFPVRGTSPLTSMWRPPVSTAANARP